jgi:hypothetical protein
MAGKRLRLMISPFASAGDTIRADIQAEDAPETTVEVFVPDTAVVSGDLKVSLGSGTFDRSLEWRVVHVQPGTTPLVEVSVEAGSLSRKGLCKLRS